MAARGPVAQPPRRAVPGRLLPAMGTTTAAATTGAVPPRPPSPRNTRRRSPRPWHARPVSAPSERPSGGLDGTEPTAPAAIGPEPKPQVQQGQPAVAAAPPAAVATAHRGRRPVSAPQFRRGRAVPASVAAKQPDRSSLKTPADGMNRPKTPAASVKTAPLQRSGSAVDGAAPQQPRLRPGSAMEQPAALLEFRGVQPDRGDLKTPMDGTSRPNSSLGRNAPTKTPPAPGACASEHSMLGPMDSQMELPLPFSMEAECQSTSDADASVMWEPSPRTMDELDAEVMVVTGVTRDGTPAKADPPASQDRTAITRPSSAPQMIPRPSSAKAGAFVARPKSSLGHAGGLAGNSSAVTPRRLAALQQEVRQMKAERINPTPTKKGKGTATETEADRSAEAAAAASKPEPSARPFKKRPVRPATKTKSLKQPAGLTVQVSSPNGREPTGSTPAILDSETTPATTTVGETTPDRGSLGTPEDGLISMRADSVADLWAAEDGSSGGSMNANGAAGSSSSSAGPIVVVDSKSSADALQDLLRRVDDLSARLTTSEQQKLNLSAKVKLLENGHESSPTMFDEQASMVQNQLVDLEMEKQHLEHTTHGLRGLMDSVESSWKEKYCQLAAQSMFRGSALKELQELEQTAGTVRAVEDAGCSRCTSAEDEAQNWREKAQALEAELERAGAREASVRKQMAAAVSSLEQLQEEHELTISSLHAQSAADLEQERSTVARLTEQLRSERQAATQQLTAAQMQSSSLSELQRALQTAQTELQGEREQRQQLDLQLLHLKEQTSNLQFRLSANETELLQSEGERQRSLQTEAELARSTQVSSAALLRIQELETDLQAAREAVDAAASAASPREIALSAAKAGDAVVIQHLKDEATQLRARLIATEVGAQEVAEEQTIEIKQLRTQVSDLQAAAAAQNQAKSDESVQQQADDSKQQKVAAAQLAMADDVKLSLAMSAQTASEVAAHSHQLVELATSVEEMRELMDHGTDTQMGLHEHVGTLQELLLGQQQQQASLQAGQVEQAAAIAQAHEHQLQLMSSQPPVGAAREAVRAKQTDAMQPAFSPSPAASTMDARWAEESSGAKKESQTSSSSSSRSRSKHKEAEPASTITVHATEHAQGSGSGSGSRSRRTGSSTNGQRGLRQRSSNGNSSGSTRAKQDSMRNALKQLKRELSKVQDGQAASAESGSAEEQAAAAAAAAAQLRKESSGGYGFVQTKTAADESVTIGGALAAATAATRDRRPAKLSTVGDIDSSGLAQQQQLQSSLLRSMR